MSGKLLPCPSCGVDLADRDCEETTTLVEYTHLPIFAGQRGKHEVPAWVCPECEEVVPL